MPPQPEHERPNARPSNRRPVYQADPPVGRDPAAIRRHWNARSPDFHGAHPRLLLIGELIQELAGVTSLLDIGCGPAPLRDLVSGHVEYFGIDVATDVVADLADPAHFEAVDLDERQEAFGDRRFDLVVCSGVFEYINRRQAFMDFLRRKVVPGGWLILSFTNHQHRKDGLQWLRGEFRPYADPHVNFLLVPQIRDLLRRNGWEVLRHRSLTSAGREHPLLRQCLRFPFNVWNRTYVFVCRAG